MARGFDLSALDIHAPDVIYDPSLGLLYEDGVVCDGDWITATGALATNSGDRTRRSTRDRRIVESAAIDHEIEWNDFNQKLGEKSYAALRKAATDYFNTRGRLYVVDGYFGSQADQRLKVRVICARPYHAMFMRTMLARPAAEELAEFAAPDVLILNAGQTPADPKTPGLNSAMSVSIHLAAGEIVILGSDYAAEMKAALFTLANFRHARQGVLTLRAAATEAANGDVSLFIGLPGSGKTTLAIGEGRQLIADDAVAWTVAGLVNLERGCYARCGGLAATEQPELEWAIRFGALLENVAVHPRSRQVDYRDTSLTDNTRAAIPLEHIAGAKTHGVAQPPSHVVLLACDASGVLPPVSRLSINQAGYYFLSGYSSKLSAAAGAAPEAMFSPCFGAGLGLLSPDRYLELFIDRLRANTSRVWLLNTGWTAGPPGTGERISLAYSRAILAAIERGELENEPLVADPIFRFEVPTKLAGVPSEMLKPWKAWRDSAAYRAAATRLAEQFQANFQTLAGGVCEQIAAAGPRLAEALAS